MVVNILQLTHFCFPLWGPHKDTEDVPNHLVEEFDSGKISKTNELNIRTERRNRRQTWNNLRLGSSEYDLHVVGHDWSIAFQCLWLCVCVCVYCVYCVYTVWHRALWTVYGEQRVWGFGRQMYLLLLDIFYIPDTKNSEHIYMGL